MQVIASSIRPGLPDDLLSIFFADPLCQSVPDRARLLTHALAHGECLVATENDRIVGFVVRNRAFFGQAFVPLLVVAAAHRRAGIATALLGEAEVGCQRAKLFTSTTESNVAARRLFEKCGYIPSGRIENLDDTDDELVYCKWLRREA
jgi:ribosomal protein S18 acetylase RimI-like enzyme